MTSTTFEIERTPAWRRRAFSHGGDSPTVTSRKTRPTKRRQPSGIVDPDADRLVAVLRRLLSRHRQELAAEERRDLARDAVDGEQVGAVSGRLEVEHLLDERQHVGERSPGLERVVEDDDPAVVGAEVELVLGEDHPLRDLAAQLAPLEHEPVGERRAGQRHRDLRAGAEVPGATDDRVRPVLPHVDRCQLQPVGVGMLLRLEHVADPEEPQVAEHADPVHAVDLGGRDRERVCDLLRIGVDTHVLAEPAERDPHRNCLRKRRSLSQNGRMPEMP